MNPLLHQSLPRLTPMARQVLEALYERQPATASALAQRSGLGERQVRRALNQLKDAGMLRGQRDFVWLDLVPSLQAVAAVHGTPTLQAVAA